MVNNYRLLRRILLAVSLIIGVIFLSLSFIFIIEPSGQIIGFGGVLSSLKEISNNSVLFSSLFLVGIMVLFFLGAPHVFGGLLLVARMKIGIYMSTYASSLLTTISIIGVFLLPNVIYVWIALIIGLIETVLSVLCYISYRKYVFYFNELDYRDINQNNKKLLVVYYSRDNYIRKYAYEIANKNKCAIYEILEQDNYGTNFGLIRLFYQTLFRKKPQIKDIKIDLKEYEHIYFVCGVVFKEIVSTAVEFLEREKDNLSSIEFDFIHYTYHTYEYNIEDKLPNTNLCYRSTCMHFGDVIYSKKIK